MRTLNFILFLSVIFQSEAVYYRCRYPCACDKRPKEPVCAANYRTFTNQCYLDAYNENLGRKGVYVPIAHLGPCYNPGDPNYATQYNLPEAGEETVNEKYGPPASTYEYPVLPSNETNSPRDLPTNQNSPNSPYFSPSYGPPVKPSYGYPGQNYPSNQNYPQQNYPQQTYENYPETNPYPTEVNVTYPVNATYPEVNVTYPVNATYPEVNVTYPSVNVTNPPVNVTNPPVNVTDPVYYDVTENPYEYTTMTSENTTVTTEVTVNVTVGTNATTTTATTQPTTTPMIPNVPRSLFDPPAPKPLPSAYVRFPPPPPNPPSSNPPMYAYPPSNSYVPVSY